ncbi:MAG: hypothetical protein AB8B49_09295 [Nitratireductor sp.]
MRNINAFLAISLSVGLLSLPAQALAQGVDFEGNVKHTCSINVTRDGLLDPTNGYQRLTSRSGPGIPGVAKVVASGNGFSLSVQAPTLFSSKPSSDTSSETFRAWHRSHGASYYAATQQPQTIAHGTSTIRVHMDARKTGADVFEVGNYSATVILRCE